MNSVRFDGALPRDARRAGRVASDQPSPASSLRCGCALCAQIVGRRMEDFGLWCFMAWFEIIVFMLILIEIILFFAAGLP